MHLAQCYFQDDSADTDHLLMLAMPFLQAVQKCCRTLQDTGQHILTQCQQTEAAQQRNIPETLAWSVLLTFLDSQSSFVVSPKTDIPSSDSRLPSGIIPIMNICTSGNVRSKTYGRWPDWAKEARQTCMPPWTCRNLHPHTMWAQQMRWLLKGRWDYQ